MLFSQSRWLSNITFHLQSIWLQDLVVVDSESCQTSFPSVCVPPSVQFESEQTPSCLTSRQLRSAAFAQDSVRNLQNYSYVIFLLWDQSTIERLSEAMRAALVGNNLSPAHYIELVSQSRWLSNITFHLQSIWLQDLVVVDSESCQTSFPSVCVPPSVQFESEQTPSCLTSRQLRSAAFAQDSVRNLQNYSYVIFLLWDQSTIERLSEAMRAALVGNNLSPAHYIENFISV